MMLRRIAFVLGLLAVAVGAPAFCADAIPGPIAAEVVKVTDGDTVAVKARIWLGLDIAVSVRIRGIDAPEIRGDCREEVMLAVAATDRLTEVAGAEVLLSQVRPDKYAGRVLADVANASGEDIGRLMLESGLARPYQGGRRGGWCAAAAMPQG